MASWLRSGAGPEIDYMIFEQSSDGTHFTALGPGARITQGWQITGLSLPIGQNFYLRARGRVTTGSSGASSSLIESVAQFYLLPPPYLSPLTVLGNGAFQFSFTNTHTTAFTVLATTNVALPMAQWDVLGQPMPVGDGIYQFTDPDAVNRTQRFYQLRTP
jgi:hypothetical protein